MTVTIVGIPTISSDNNLEKLAYVLGSLFGDGCFYHKERGRVIFSSADREYTEIMINYINELFNLNLKLRINKLSQKNKKWKDAYIFSSRPLYKILREFSNKDVPDFITNGSKKNKASFIKGFFDAEGNVDIHTIKKRNEMQRHLRCFSNDKEILKIIQSMLKDLHINSCIKKSKGNNLCLTIWGYNSLVNFERYVNFNINRKRLKLEKAINSYKQIQTQWNQETYNKIMELRKQNLGATLIQRKIQKNIPRPTIESWIYRGVKTRR